MEHIRGSSRGMPFNDGDKKIRVQLKVIDSPTPSLKRVGSEVDGTAVLVLAGLVEILALANNQNFCVLV